MIILEKLQNAKALINNGTMVGVGNAQAELGKCVNLLEKGYTPVEDVEALIKKYGALESVPARDAEDKETPPPTVPITIDGEELEMTIEDIKDNLKELGIDFQDNTGIKKLAAKLQKALDEVKPD